MTNMYILSPSLITNKKKNEMMSDINYKKGKQANLFLDHDLGIGLDVFEAVFEALLMPELLSLPLLSL